MNNEKDFREFENLPEGWKFSKVKDLFMDGRGRIISEEEIKNREGIYPVYSSQTSNNGELGKINTYDFEGEFITWTTDGANAGTVFYRNGKFNCTNVCGILKPRNENINVKFFSYLLSTIAKNYVSYIGNPKLMNSTFRDIKIIHPNDYYEQSKIAEILETVDNAIEKTDKIIEKYKRIKQGLMQDLLTKGIDENGNIRSEKTHKFKDSPLGRIPEEWEVVRLGEVSISINYGYTQSAKEEEIGPKFLRITDIQENKVNWDNVPYCNISYSQLSKYLLKDGDIVFARTGATTGKSYYIENPPIVIFASYLIRVRVSNKAMPKFIWIFFNSEKYWKQINLDIAGSTQEGFNASKLKKILIPLPTLPEQQRIAKILSQTDQTIEKEQQYKEKLQKIKQGLMQDLLTGKVRVNHLINEGQNNEA